MSNKLNLTGLTYFYNRLKTVFASKTELGALSDRVDEIVAEGGEPNVIEVIKKNGTALTPDANKAVDISVPVSSSDLSDGSSLATKDYVAQEGGKINDISINGVKQTISEKTAVIRLHKNGTPLTPDLEDGSFDISVPESYLDLTDGSALATKDYVAQEGGKIDKIKVNGTEQTIKNKEVDITVPTKTSDIVNDSTFPTQSEMETYVTTVVNEHIASVYRMKEPVATYANLPTTGNEKGDVRETLDTGHSYVWDGTQWDSIGQLVDMSLYWSKAELVDITTAEIDTIIDGE